MNILRFSDLIAEGRVAGQRVFIRADLNVPQDDAGNITEDTRIRASVPCIQHGARGRRGGDGHLAPGPPDRGRVQARGFAGAGRRSAWPSCWAATVPLRADWVDGVDVQPGELVLLENCRVNKGEKKNDEALAQQDGRAVRHLRARRLRHRAPRRGHHLRHRAVRAGRLRRPAAGRRDRRHPQGAGAARSGRWWRSSPAPRSAPS